MGEGEFAEGEVGEREGEERKVGGFLEIGFAAEVRDACGVATSQPSSLMLLSPEREDAPTREGCLRTSHSSHSSSLSA